MDIQARALAIVEKLKEIYPETDCSLTYKEPWQLLFSARLAAQCTDERVNQVAVPLYAKYPTLEAFANADLDELEAIIRPTGFFRIKARDLKNAAILLLSKFGGQVPHTMDELLEIPGVGRKVANLMLGDIYKQPAIVADTHCIRLSNRFGLCDSKDPKKVEFRLKELIPPEEQNDFCHRLVWYGRAVCTARSPKCHDCELFALCARVGVK